MAWADARHRTANKQVTDSFVTMLQAMLVRIGLV
jgi:hypothetical protein